MTAKALLIGGTGPTGPHVLVGLLRRGFEVSLLHRGVHEPDGLPEVEHIHADPHFRETLVGAIEKRSFDVVVASYGRLRVIAEALAGRCSQFIGIGGMPVYAGFVEPERQRPYGGPVGAREDSPLASEVASPSSIATALELAERGVLDRSAAGVYAGTIVRYPQIYGPRNVMPWEWSVLRHVVGGRRRMLLPDDGLWIISRCAARNAAEAVLTVVDHPEKAMTKAFNCADHDQFTLRQWAEMITEFAGGELELVGVPSALAPSALIELLPPGARPHLIVDASAIERELGYREVVDARSALAQTVAWLLENPVEGPEYPAMRMLDFDIEDRLIDAYRCAAQQLADAVPDPGLSVPHAMPHPRVPSLGLDDRGR